MMFSFRLEISIWLFGVHASEADSFLPRASLMINPHDFFSGLPSVTDVSYSLLFGVPLSLDNGNLNFVFNFRNYNR